MKEIKNMDKSRKKSAVLFACIFVVLGMWMMLSVHCQAAETNNDEKQPQTIRVGSFEDTFNYVDKNGVRRGYGYELMQALAGYTGWKFEYVKCDWSNCFDPVLFHIFPALLFPVCLSARRCARRRWLSLNQVQLGRSMLDSWT